MADNQQTKTLIPTQWIADNFGMLESASVTLCIVSYLLRVFDVEGWGLAVGISFSFYAAFVYLAAFIPHTTNSLVASVATRVCGISGSVTLIGLLFTFLHFPGAKSMLQIGSVTLGIAGIILLVLFATSKEKAHLRSIIRSLLLALFGIAHLIYQPGLV
ncbi:MAG: hypothetical protein RIC35_01900 [Marinoscillum sp.]